MIKLFAKEIQKMDYKRHIAKGLEIYGVSEEEIYSAIALPPNSEMGDYALPCFKFAKILRKSPVAIAEELKNSYVCDELISGFVRCFEQRR